MAKWVDSNGNYHNTDSNPEGVSSRDQGDLGKAIDPGNQGAVNAAVGSPGYIDYTKGAGSGGYDRSTNTFYSGDQANPSDWYGNPTVSTSGTAASGTPAQGGNSMAQTVSDPGAGAGGAGAAPGSATNAYKDWWSNYSPGDPSRWKYGWADTLKSTGMDPYGNNPVQRAMSDPSTYQPLMYRFLMDRAMGNQGAYSETDVMDPMNAFKGFMQNGLAGAGGALGGGMDMLQQLKQKFMASLDPNAAPVSGPGYALQNALSTDDTAAVNYIGSALSAGLDPNQAAASMARMNMYRNQYETEGGQNGDKSNNLAQWFLNKYVK